MCLTQHRPVFLCRKCGRAYFNHEQVHRRVRRGSQTRFKTGPGLSYERLWYWWALTLSENKTCLYFAICNLEDLSLSLHGFTHRHRDPAYNGLKSSLVTLCKSRCTKCLLQQVFYVFRWKRAIFPNIYTTYRCRNAQTTELVAHLLFPHLSTNMD